MGSVRCQGPRRRPKVHLRGEWRLQAPLDSYITRAATFQDVLQPQDRTLQARRCTLTKRRSGLAVRPCAARTQSRADFKPQRAQTRALRTQMGAAAQFLDAKRPPPWIVQDKCTAGPEGAPCMSSVIHADSDLLLLFLMCLAAESP